ncbi:MAG: hypothetical protein EP319_13335 [Deltaproteobacteria bacterium]|nr:MAG: hypothetical protein EP319_13335 [Deltaproteobacteria bacterium]
MLLFTSCSSSFVYEQGHQSDFSNNQSPQSIAANNDSIKSQIEGLRAQLIHLDGMIASTQSRISTLEMNRDIGGAASARHELAGLQAQKGGIEAQISGLEAQLEIP